MIKWLKYTKFDDLSIQEKARLFKTLARGGALNKTKPGEYISTIKDMYNNIFVEGGPTTQIKRNVSTIDDAPEDVQEKYYTKLHEANIAEAQAKDDADTKDKGFLSRLKDSFVQATLNSQAGEPGGTAVMTANGWTMDDNGNWHVPTPESINSPEARNMQKNLAIIGAAGVAGTGISAPAVSTTIGDAVLAMPSEYLSGMATYLPAGSKAAAALTAAGPWADAGLMSYWTTEGLMAAGNNFSNIASADNTLEKINQGAQGAANVGLAALPLIGPAWYAGKKLFSGTKNFVRKVGSEIDNTLHYKKFYDKQVSSKAELSDLIDQKLFYEKYSTASSSDKLDQILSDAINGKYGPEVKAFAEAQKVNGNYEAYKESLNSRSYEALFPSTSNTVSITSYNGDNRIPLSYTDFSGNTYFDVATTFGDLDLSFNFTYHPLEPHLTKIDFLKNKNARLFITGFEKAGTKLQQQLVEDYNIINKTIGNNAVISGSTSVYIGNKGIKTTGIPNDIELLTTRARFKNLSKDIEFRDLKFTGTVHSGEAGAFPKKQVEIEVIEPGMDAKHSRGTVAEEVYMYLHPTEYKVLREEAAFRQKPIDIPMSPEQILQTFQQNPELMRQKTIMDNLMSGKGKHNSRMFTVIHENPGEVSKTIDKLGQAYFGDEFIAYENEALSHIDFTNIEKNKEFLKQLDLPEEWAENIAQMKDVYKTWKFQNSAVTRGVRGTGLPKQEYINRLRQSFGEQSASGPGGNTVQNSKVGGGLQYGEPGHFGMLYTPLSYNEKSFTSVMDGYNALKRQKLVESNAPLSEVFTAAQIDVINNISDHLHLKRPTKTSEVNDLIQDYQKNIINTVSDSETRSKYMTQLSETLDLPAVRNTDKYYEINNDGDVKYGGFVGNLNSNAMYTFGDRRILANSAKGKPSLEPGGMFTGESNISSEYKSFINSILPEITDKKSIDTIIKNLTPTGDVNSIKALIKSTIIKEEEKVQKNAKALRTVLDASKNGTTSSVSQEAKDIAENISQQYLLNTGHLPSQEEIEGALDLLEMQGSLRTSLHKILQKQRAAEKDINEFQLLYEKYEKKYDKAKTVGVLASIIGGASILGTATLGTMVNHDNKIVKLLKQSGYYTYDMNTFTDTGEVIPNETLIHNAFDMFGVDRVEDLPLWVKTSLNISPNYASYNRKAYGGALNFSTSNEPFIIPVKNNMFAMGGDTPQTESKPVTPVSRVNLQEWYDTEGLRGRATSVSALEQLQDSLVARYTKNPDRYGFAQRLAILATAAEEMDKRGAASKGVGGNGYLGLSAQRMPVSYLDDSAEGRGKQIHYILEDLNTTHSDNWLNGGSGGPVIMSGQDGYDKFWSSNNVYDATRILNKSYVRPSGREDAWNNRADTAKSMQKHTTTSKK